MNINKVKAYLIDSMADPFDCKVAELLHDRLNNDKSPIGNLLIRMLKAAERGDFKDVD